ncbi:MAG: glycosyltransferase [Bacillota bacterium]
MSTPLRVLHILSSTMRAGVEMMVMNLYRETDREKLQFDFVAHDLGEDDLGAEIEDLGGRVFKVPLLSKVGMTKFVNIIYDIIMKNGPYIAVHTHTDYQGGFSAIAAKKAGVQRRICHAHLDTRGMRSPVFLAKKLLGRALIQRCATQRCACSKYAGIALHGKRAVEKGHVEIINNGIDVSGYQAFDPESREKLLQDCNASGGARLIGNVARLNPVKNQSFILDMAAEAKKRGLNYRFVLVGSGDLLEDLLQKRNRAGLEDTVFFLGTREDIPQLMQCFDAFVLPSLAEGLPLTAIEAQAAGTPVIAASCVPLEADMGLGLLHRLPLEKGAVAWLSQIGSVLDTAKRPDAAPRIDAVRQKGFDAKYNVNTVMALYGLSNQA